MPLSNGWHCHLGVGMSKELAEINELLNDARDCTRLTKFETEFLDTVADLAARYGDKLKLSQRQWAVFEDIQMKVYST